MKLAKQIFSFSIILKQLFSWPWFIILWPQFGGWGAKQEIMSTFFSIFQSLINEIFLAYACPFTISFCHKLKSWGSGTLSPDTWTEVKVANDYKAPKSEKRRHYVHSHTKITHCNNFFNIIEVTCLGLCSVELCVRFSNNEHYQQFFSACIHVFCLHYKQKKTVMKQ